MESEQRKARLDELRSKVTQSIVERGLAGTSSTNSARGQRFVAANESMAAVAAAFGDDASDQASQVLQNTAQQLRLAIKEDKNAVPDLVRVPQSGSNDSCVWQCINYILVLERFVGKDHTPEMVKQRLIEFYRDDSNRNTQLMDGDVGNTYMQTVESMLEVWHDCTPAQRANDLEDIYSDKAGNVEMCVAATIWPIRFMIYRYPVHVLRTSGVGPFTHIRTIYNAIWNHQTMFDCHMLHCSFHNVLLSNGDLPTRALDHFDLIRPASEMYECERVYSEQALANAIKYEDGKPVSNVAMAVAVEARELQREEYSSSSDDGRSDEARTDVQDDDTDPEATEDEAESEAADDTYETEADTEEHSERGKTRKSRDLSPTDSPSVSPAHKKSTTSAFAVGDPVLCKLSDRTQAATVIQIGTKENYEHQNKIQM